MIRAKVSSIAVLALLLLTGCGKRTPPPTLVVHMHDGVFDFIDHDGRRVGVVGNIEECVALLKEPAIKQLIRRNRVVVRCQRVNDGKGVGPSDEVLTLAGRLLGGEVDNVEVDYIDE